MGGNWGTARQAVLAAALVAPGFAGAQSLGFSLDATVGAELAYSDGDYVLSTELGLSGASATRSTRVFYDFGLETGYRSRSGEIDDLSPSLTVGFEQTGKRTTVGGTASYEVTPVSFIDFTDELVSFTDEGYRDRLRLTGSLDHTLSRRASLSLSASYEDTDYTDSSPDLVPALIIDTDASLRYQLTDRIGSSFSLGYRVYEPEDAVDTRSTTLSASAGFSLTATERLTVNGSAGLSLTDTTNDLGADREDEELELGLDMTYAMRNGSIAASFSQDVSPSAEGELRLSSTATLAFDTALNDVTDLSVDASISRSSGLAGGDDEEETTFGASLERDLTRTLVGSVGYEYAREDDADAEHRVTLGLTRTFRLVQ